MQKPVKSEQNESPMNNTGLSKSTPSGVRTLDPLIKSQLLYQLS